MVLLDVVNRLAREYPPHSIRLFSYRPVESLHQERVAGLGVELQILDDWSQCPRLQRGDVVFMNTVAYHPHVKDTIFGAVERDEIRKVIWYIHEDEPEFHFSAPEVARVRRMIESGRLEILVPAKQICDRYRRYLGAGVTRELYRIDLPALQVKPRARRISRRSGSSCPAGSRTTARASSPSSTPSRRSTTGISRATRPPTVIST